MIACTSVLPLRPREKLLAHGAAELSDLELVALFLGSGARGQSSLHVAQTLLERSGSLRSLLLTQPARALRMYGMGPARYSRFQSALELARRVRREQEKTTVPSTPAYFIAPRSQAHQQLLDSVVDLSFQGFAAAFYRPNGECVACERFFRGTLEHVYIHPREMVRRALTLKARSVSVARGDSEGTPRLTEADQSMHAQLTRALAVIDVELRSYYVVGQSGLAVTLGDRSDAHLQNQGKPQQLALDLSFPGSVPGIELSTASLSERLVRRSGSAPPISICCSD